MSTDLILLGTAGGPTPKPNRSAPSQAVVVNGATYVVDCGNGVAHQMARAGLDSRDLRSLFITHQHSDHNADYAALLLLAWASNLVDPVDTFGPPPLIEMTEYALKLNAYDIALRIADEGRPPLAPLIRAHEVTAPGVIYEDDNVRVSAALVNHPPIEVALAYRIDTPDRSIVFSGDTTVSANLIELAQGADILVHECIYLPAIDEMAAKDPDASGLREHLENSHTSVDDVGSVATQAQVGTLVLSHLVPSNAGLPDSLWAETAAKSFDGKIVVGQDLMVL